jgi:hypothetical protein
MKKTQTPRPEPFPDASERIRRDLGALAARSRRNPPSFTHTIRALSGQHGKGTREERPMAWTGFLKMHPRAATLAVTAAVAAALLVVPVSYTKVVGHEVAVSLDGGKVSRDLVLGLAAELKEALNTDAVTVAVDQNDGATAYILRATAPEKNAPAVSRAFARALTSRGIPAEAQATPVRKTVSGNVYAMAYNTTFGSAIQVEIDGKSAEEIEAEILAHLEAAGFDARVSVTLEGDDHMKIEVEAESEAPDGGAADDRARRIVLTRDGQPLSGTFAESTVRMTKAVDETGERLTVEVMDGDRTVSATVRDPRSLSDAELAETVRRQLADQGLEASVSAENGRVRVLTPETPAATPVEKTTWGRIKKELGDPD